MLSAPADKPGGNGKGRTAILSKFYETAEDGSLSEVAAEVFGKPEDKNDDLIAEAYRGELNSELPGDDTTDMNDDQILAVVRAVPGEGDDVHLARIKALKSVGSTPSEPLPDTRDVHVRGDASAIELGHKFSPAMVAELNTEWTAKKTVDGAPVMLDSHLMTDIGLTAIVALPVPGSRHNKPPYNIEAGKPGHTNQRPDHYKRVDQVSGDDVTGSVIADMWDASTLGTGYYKTRELLKLYSDAAQSMSETQKKEIVAFTGEKWDDLAIESVYENAKSENDNRRSFQIAKLRTAITFRQMADRIETECPLIGWMFVNDVDAKKAASLKRPVVLLNKQKSASSKSLSLSDFNRLSFDKALVNAKQRDPKAQTKDITMADLRTTVGKRGKKKEAPKGDDKSGATTAIKLNAQMAESYFSGLANFFDRKSDGYTKRITDLTELVGKPDNKDAIRMVGDFLAELNEWFQPFAPTYVDMKEDDRNAIAAATKNKNKAGASAP